MDMVDNYTGALRTVPIYIICAHEYLARISEERCGPRLVKPWIRKGIRLVSVPCRRFPTELYASLLDRGTR